MNMKRWANLTFCLSPWGILFLECRTTIRKLPKRQRRTKQNPSKVLAVSISDTTKPPEMAISTNYLLRIFFNFPDVETMMLKAHPSYSQELEQLFPFLQAKHTFIKIPGGRTGGTCNNEKYFCAACWLPKQFPTLKIPFSVQKSSTCCCAGLLS